MLTFGVESPLLKEEINARLKQKGNLREAPVCFAPPAFRLPFEDCAQLVQVPLSASMTRISTPPS
jgi:hypothetical protein